MKFSNATGNDIEEITELYREAMGSPGCHWSPDYPNQEITLEDLARKDLFCLKNENGIIIGAISVDNDDEVKGLPCWTQTLQPGAELARLVVREEYRNQGIARQLITCVMNELEKREYRSVHFLVSKAHERALRSYAKLDFVRCGEVDLYGEHFWCYEKELFSGGK